MAGSASGPTLRRDALHIPLRHPSRPRTPGAAGGGGGGRETEVPGLALGDHVELAGVLPGQQQPGQGVPDAEGETRPTPRRRRSRGSGRWAPWRRTRGGAVGTGARRCGPGWSPRAAGFPGGAARANSRAMSLSRATISRRARRNIRPAVRGVASGRSRAMHRARGRWPSAPAPEAEHARRNHSRVHQVDAAADLRVGGEDGELATTSRRSGRAGRSWTSALRSAASCGRRGSGYLEEQRLRRSTFLRVASSTRRSPARAPAVQQHLTGRRRRASARAPTSTSSSATAARYAARSGSRARTGGPGARWARAADGSGGRDGGLGPPARASAGTRMVGSSLRAGHGVDEPETHRKHLNPWIPEATSDLPRTTPYPLRSVLNRPDNPAPTRTTGPRRGHRPARPGRRRRGQAPRRERPGTAATRCSPGPPRAGPVLQARAAGPVQHVQRHTHLRGEQPDRVVRGAGDEHPVMRPRPGTPGPPDRLVGSVAAPHRLAASRRRCGR